MAVVGPAGSNTKASAHVPRMQHTDRHALYQQHTLEFEQKIGAPVVVCKQGLKASPVNAAHHSLGHTDVVTAVAGNSGHKQESV